VFGGVGVSANVIGECESGREGPMGGIHGVTKIAIVCWVNRLGEMNMRVGEGNIASRRRVAEETSDVFCFGEHVCIIKERDLTPFLHKTCGICRH
jgi:hypothetical protein